MEYDAGEGVLAYVQEHKLRLVSDEVYYRSNGVATGDSVAYALHPDGRSLVQLVYIDELNSVYAFQSGLSGLTEVTNLNPHGET